MYISYVCGLSLLFSFLPNWGGFEAIFALTLLYRWLLRIMRVYFLLSFQVALSLEPLSHTKQPRCRSTVWKRWTTRRSWPCMTVWTRRQRSPTWSTVWPASSTSLWRRARAPSRVHAWLPWMLLARMLVGILWQNLCFVVIGWGLMSKISGQTYCSTFWNFQTSVVVQCTVSGRIAVGCCWGRGDGFGVFIETEK